MGVWVAWNTRLVSLELGLGELLGDRNWFGSAWVGVGVQMLSTRVGGRAGGWLGGWVMGV